MVQHSEHEPTFPFPILIGDIGGTNARFAILVDALSEPKTFPNVATADFATIDEAIQTSVLDKTSLQPRSAILAVAGPVDGDEIDLTNCPWVVRPKMMMADLGFGEVVVVNDFAAQALAVASLEDANRHQIGKGTVEAHASRIVLGPGTGLGVAGLVYAQRRWIPVPGEGGHIDMGPRSKRDFEIFPHLEPIDGRISAEQILCGRGIVNIYRAVCAADGRDALHDTPADITTAGLAGEEPAAETLRLFATYLGRCAGDLALIFMAKGGVYLAGGISQKIVKALEGPEFRAAFEDKAPHNALLAGMPTFVMTHPLAALSGLAAYARTPSFFGISVEGRHWKHGA